MPLAGFVEFRAMTPLTDPQLLTDIYQLAMEPLRVARTGE
jgi:hypothetical protein